ncbi:methyltransferase domain-containing protein [Brevundimonas sp. R86498]|uniref:methyltransferase domain-containing protein n=1 Tax=Brevundimonas sp. R86498 TaxID=3093845 RepID=UPI0037C93D9B
MKYQIEIFTAFDGQLSLAGWVETAATKLTLHLDDGQIIEVPTVRDGLIARFHLRSAYSSITPYNAELHVGQEAIGQLYSTVDLAHGLYPRFFEALPKTGALLEIGSRARSGFSRREMTPAGWTYTGLDVLDGENVDVVGDAHRLSKLFPDQRFDAVLSVSVLEHILMPWKLAIEMNRILNVGAVGFFMTHQGWPLHDAPWDFWRFSDQAWRALFNPATGFEIIEAHMGDPVYMVPRHLHAACAYGMDYLSYGASAVLFRKISETTLEWPVELEDIITTSYPSTTGIYTG